MIFDENVTKKNFSFFYPFYYFYHFSAEQYPLGRGILENIYPYRMLFRLSRIHAFSVRQRLVFIVHGEMPIIEMPGYMLAQKESRPEGHAALITAML